MNKKHARELPNLVKVSRILPVSRLTLIPVNCIHINMSSIANGIYNRIFRRNSVYVASIFAAAFGFEMVFMTGTQRFYDHWNRGKQWKDIRDKYVNKDSDSGDDDD